MVALVVEAALEQFSARGYAVMGLEALVVLQTVHYFGIESYDGSASVGEFSCVLGEFLTRLFHLRVGRGAPGPGGAPGCGGVAGADVIVEFGESDFDEFLGGVHAVVGLEALVVEFTLGDLHEEADDASSAVCFFCDYFG